LKINKIAEFLNSFLFSGNIGHRAKSRRIEKILITKLIADIKIKTNNKSS
jgi:hypothetical protein